MSEPPKTIDEAAAFFRVKRRFFQDFIKDHPFYHPFGRRKLFFPEDLARIKEALPTPCPSNSAPRAKARRLTMKSAAPTSESTLSELRKLLTKSRPPKPCAPSSEPSNVVSLPQHRRR